MFYLNLVYVIETNNKLTVIAKYVKVNIMHTWDLVNVIIIIPIFYVPNNVIVFPKLIRSSGTYLNFRKI